LEIPVVEEGEEQEEEEQEERNTLMGWLKWHICHGTEYYCSFELSLITLYIILGQNTLPEETCPLQAMVQEHPQVPDVIKGLLLMNGVKGAEQPSTKEVTIFIALCGGVRECRLQGILGARY
jgi:hypothetical protein